jgi:hypothetical protein
MEVIIPPRDHKATTYRYTWDEHGEVQRVERCGPPSHELRAQAARRSQGLTETPHRVNESVDYGSSRQTVQWPFQHNSTESHASTPRTTSFPRRATWQVPKTTDHNSPTESLEKDIIPDYVVNFLRGETPETLARKKRQRQTMGARDITMQQNLQRYVSHSADFYDSASSNHRGSSRGNGDLEGSLREKMRGGGSGFRRLLSGWRAGVALNALITFLILVMAIICLTLAISRTQVLGGETAIYNGSCAMTAQINASLHFAINIVVVILIAGANYLFQVLSSPTRVEVAVAHDRKKWLDIGIPSLRNLSAISSSRVFMTSIILIAAVSTQIM